MKADYPIAQLCLALGVSRSGFYAWSTHWASPKTAKSGWWILRPGR
jgi:hypothetical protein